MENLLMNSLNVICNEQFALDFLMLRHQINHISDLNLLFLITIDC